MKRTNTMNITLHTCRKIVVNHFFHSFEVHASRHYFCTDHDPTVTSAHPPDCVLSLLSAHACVKAVNMRDAVESEFFSQSVQVPLKAKQARLTGDVVVQATVDTNGKLVSPKIAQGLSPECNAEALRVVQTMPAWQPATRRGVPVAVLVQVPVPFNNAQITRFENDRRVPRSAKEAPGL